MQRLSDLPPSCTSFVTPSRLPRRAYIQSLLLAIIPVMLAAITVLVVRDAFTDSNRREPTATTPQSSPFSFQP